PARTTRCLSDGGRGLSQPLCLSVLHRLDGAALFTSESRGVEPVPIARDKTKDISCVNQSHRASLGACDFCRQLFDSHRDHVRLCEMSSLGNYRILQYET